MNITAAQAHEKSNKFWSSKDKINPILDEINARINRASFNGKFSCLLTFAGDVMPNSVGKILRSLGFKVDRLYTGAYRIAWSNESGVYSQL